MLTLFYIEQNKLYRFKDGATQPLNCEAIDLYTKNLKQIHKRKEWKTQGTGAAFAGIQYQDVLNLDEIYPSDIAFVDKERFIYSANLQSGTAIQAKLCHHDEQKEGLILRHEQHSVFDLSYDSKQNRLALSILGDGYGERHLAILPLENGRIQSVTEGDCRDCNPVFDPKDTQTLYYDSTGLAYTANELLTSPRTIMSLNLSTGQTKEILSDENYDYFKPYVDSQGNLYCIRKPYISAFGLQSPTKTLKNILTAPIKLIKAIFGWLDNFTQRYGGETLKTSGANPAKIQQKSQEEHFIEGNLIKVQQNFLNNQKAGDAYPANIPNTWELIKLDSQGAVHVIKKGVMSFAIGKDGALVYSNGRYLLLHNPDDKDTLLTQASFVSKLEVY